MWSEDDSHFATGGIDGRARIWLADGTLLHDLTSHGSPVRAVRFLHDGDVLAAAALDGTLRYWDARTARLLHTAAGIEDPHPPLLPAANGRRVVISASDCTVRFLRVPDLKSGGQTLMSTGDLTNLRVCPDTFDVIPVNPYPDAGTVWAPADRCEKREPSDDELKPGR